MFGMSATVEMHTDRVEKAVEKASFRNLRHAAFSISKDAKSTIVTSDEASQPGSPPTTRGRGGHNLRGAIFVDADKESAVIGPRSSLVGDVGHAHEFGAERKGDEFAERSFMKPALIRGQSRFLADWQGSVG